MCLKESRGGTTVGERIIVLNAGTRVLLLVHNLRHVLILAASCGAQEQGSVWNLIHVSEVEHKFEIRIAALQTATVRRRVA